ncbi:DUF4132 domain-containing protein [Glycomyces arizonensis]|uniref:DUF4132 domain-containing protein n=1 Tax=Glycomyces arizonensis TaxID=256035 RepID=UPI0003F8183D|nr:DUF4132 domain-containing protein [Glycomyces arizonensis]
MNHSDNTGGTADEDRLRLPESWRRHVLPWRGRDAANSADLDTEIDPAASEAVARRIEEFRPLIERAMAKGGSAEHYIPLVKDHLEGRPNPAGAAALAQMLESTDYRKADPAGRRRHLDAWLTDHGLAFATAAVLESSMMHGYPLKESSYLSWPISSYSYLYQHEVWKDLQGSLLRIRSLLALAPESEYREIVAAIDPLRTDAERRIAAALLMPTEAAWVKDACDALDGYFSHQGDDWPMWSFAAAPEYLGLFRRRHVETDHIDARNLAPLLAGLGTGALPFLTSALEWGFGRLSKPARAALLTAIGLLPSDEATGHLIDKLELSGALSAVIDVAERFPHRTLRVVAARLDGADPAMRARLTGVVKSSPALNAALPAADERTREAIAALVDEPGRVPDAPAEALPPLLAAPPWTAKRRRPKPVVVDGLEASGATRLVWADGERERWASLEHDYYSRYCGEDWWKDEAAKAVKHDRATDYTRVLAYAPMEIAASLPTEARERFGFPHAVGDLQAILGRFGTEVADRIVELIAVESVHHKALPPIVSPAAARLAADWLARLKSARASAAAWFDRNGREGAPMLVPDALGTGKRARRSAEAALAYVARRHGADVVLAAAESYGETALEAVRALLDADPLDPREAKLPKTPAWAEAAMLPQVLLKGRRAALPPASVGHLTTVLAIDKPEFPYAGVDVVAEACDGDSLRDFSWALFEQWIAVGGPAKEGWAFTQLAHFADEETIRELAEMVRVWPGQRQHKRAVTGLEVLGAIGSESALRAIHVISRKVKFKGIKQEAKWQIDAIAEGLGLTVDQLADRLVPDFGLDDGTSLVLDYGPRRFTVGFDEQLKPFVADEGGKPLGRLPKPGAKDDAELAEAAYERFAQLRKELRTVAKEQVRRCERAMVDQRAWTVPEFGEFFVDHPLMRHLARRLVWLAESDGERRGFRLAEDTTVTDVEDDGFELPGDAVIRLAHPVMLGDRLATWSELFADYEILQPFKQLARPIPAFTDEELKTGRITRFDGATLKSGSVIGLATHWGWERPASDGFWVEPGLHRPLPAGGFVVVSLDPGVESYLGRIDSSQVQTVRAVRLSATADYGEDSGGAHPTDIDALTAAEVLGDLARVTGTA